MKIYIVVHEYRDEIIIQGVFSDEVSALNLLKQEGFIVPGPRESFLTIYGFKDFSFMQPKYNLSEYDWSGCGQMSIEIQELITPELRKEVLREIENFTNEAMDRFGIYIKCIDKISTFDLHADAETCDDSQIAALYAFYHNHMIYKKYSHLLDFMAPVKLL